MKPDQAERRVIFLFNDLIVEAKPSKKVPSRRGTNAE
jgi:hypothetical protein